MTLSEAVGHAIDLSVWAHQHINEIDIPDEVRDKIALAAFQQSLDVDDAISLLIEKNLPGPAYSLARPLLESYICGVWLLKCANKQQIEAFTEGKMPKIPTMIKAMDKNPETGSAWIKRTVELNMKSFHELTHGGMEHVIRRISPDSIEPKYPDDEKIGLLKMGMEIRIHICAFILELIGNQKSLDELQKMARFYRALP